MIMDKPLPIPRWLMSSPSHMSTAVPATRVMMTRMPRGHMPSGSSCTFGVLCAAPKKALPRPSPKTNVRPVAWSNAMAMAR